MAADRRHALREIRFPQGVDGLSRTYDHQHRVELAYRRFEKYKVTGRKNEIQRAFNLSCVDKTLTCLYEGIDKTGKHLIYRTPYMQQCIVEFIENAPTMANIKIASANKACLRGEFVD